MINPQPYPVSESNPAWQKLELYWQTKQGKQNFHHLSFSQDEKTENFIGNLIVNDKLFNCKLSKLQAKGIHGDENPEIKVKETLAQQVIYAYGNKLLDLDDDYEMTDMFLRMSCWSAITQVNTAFPGIKFKKFNLFEKSLFYLQVEYLKSEIFFHLAMFQDYQAWVSVYTISQYRQS